MKLRSKEKKVMSRNYVLLALLSMIGGGLLLGIAIAKTLAVAGLANMVNISVCMILYTIVCIFLWLPLIVPMLQVMDIDENAVYIMPRYNSMKKLSIAWYALINDNIRPFYRSIPLDSIDHITFTFEARWGSYAYQRFSYVLIFYVKDEVIRIYIDPLQNGPIMPSGFGMPFTGTLSRDDIANQIDFYIANHVLVKDPYKLNEALKDSNVVMYDYMVSLHKNIIF